MRLWAFATLLICGIGSVAAAQRIPTLPTRGSAPPIKRDSTDSTRMIRWTEPDSIAQLLLAKPGYSITRYQGDTTYFNAQTNTLDILAAGKQRAAVERDSQLVVSDSGIYYTQKSKRVVAGGHYVLSSPGSGQADVVGVGRVSYDLSERLAHITNARLPVNAGEVWYITVSKAAVQQQDTTTPHAGVTTWAGAGTMTSCDDSIPDYHFAFKELKRTSSNTIVTRSDVLYIKDVPVFWLPFVFSDTRKGRHSGILPPQFGVGDIVRNSPTYRRNVDHVGYYWALSDYMDVATWLDWRSSAGATEIDPGWLKYNADWNYRWLDRFMSGRIGTSYTTQSNGLTNLALSWGHQQEFSRNSRLNMNVNYVTSTTLQRQNTFNPIAAIATIASDVSYQAKLGPASLSLGASQKQYPGRPTIDRTFPTLSITATPIAVGTWLSWTPSFSISRSDRLHMDQPGLGAYVYQSNPVSGLVDSSLSNSRHSSESTISFTTPLQIFGYDLRNSFQIHQQRNDFPEQIQLHDVVTGDLTDTRVYASTYRTDIDWTPDFTLPSIARNKFNLTPSVSLQNVDGGPFWVATQLTNGRYVHQSKRLAFGLSASPTLFGFFPGFGPFTRIRHSFTPSLSYSFAPPADVSDEYLAATGRSRKGYLGSRRQSAVSFGLTQNFEAKVRSHNDTSGTDEGEKIRLLSMNFTSLSYDFERAKGYSAIRGLTTENVGYSLSSDLLPGFDFSSSYSLFQGSTSTDTAVFKPYLTNVSASFSIGHDQNPLTVLTKLFGRAVPQAQTSPTPSTETVRPPPDDQETRLQAAQPVAGLGASGDRFLVPSSQGWKASLSFTRSSPRPPVGTNVIDYDPRTRCQQLVGNDPFLLDACLAQQRAQPTNDLPIESTVSGGTLYRIPPTTSLNGNISFNLTPKWTASWQTTYDFERREFASHIVSLQRDIHDWRAIFGFTQSPNGNFAFNFRIALKAEPDLKFDYNRATVRSGAAPF